MSLVLNISILNYFLSLRFLVTFRNHLLYVRSNNNNSVEMIYAYYHLVFLQ